MSVRTNKLRHALAAGTPQIGTWINITRNPAIFSLFHDIGLDFVQLDMEHSPPSIETVANMAITARALDIPLLVRPPVANREWISRILDAGAWGIYAPQVETPEAAHEVVRAARHAPTGDRGTFEPGPQNDYTEPSDPTGSLKYLNEQVHITAVLESVDAFRHLDEIVGMQGIDTVGVGAADLAQDLNVYGTPDELK